MDNSQEFDMFNRREDQRKDALFTEAHVLFSIHNLLVTHGATAWEVTQQDLAEYLKLGERSVQRVTKRLEEMGRLHRTAGEGQASYIYSIPPGSVEEMLFDVFTKSNLFIVQTANGCISILEDFETYWQMVIANPTDKN